MLNALSLTIDKISPGDMLLRVADGTFTRTLFVVISIVNDKMIYMVHNAKAGTHVMTTSPDNDGLIFVQIDTVLFTFDGAR